ncbi:peptidyl-prolyl cis-trans isomerase [Paenibacillus ginsengihumi]|uniref:peptidyl-prolyl cis-trans isomerase n=1 Tax=Paenibacillus ginsengihumi TaxID=431596 RepID=UPI000373DFC3|nr:peptidyl-prolyl cis-trans isomerase [Paenibacillus ginsengihumi]
MRNVKMLWATNAVLLTAVIVLSSILAAEIFRAPASPEPSEPGTAHADDVVAVIGDTEITRQQLLDHLVQKYGKEQLNQMIDTEVVQLEGQSLGISVTPAEIEQELKRMQQGYDSEQQFYESMKEQLGLTREALENDIYNKLLTEKLAIKDIRIDDALVDEYVKAHPEQFAGRVQMHLQIIVVGSLDHANRAMNDIARGTDFEAVAKERSLDDATRDAGGDMGWVEADDPFVPRAVMDAVKTMRTGEVSKPLKIDDQYVIVKVKERKEEAPLDMKIVREQVRKELALQEAPPIRDMLAKLRDKWKVSVYLSIDK